MRAIMLFFAALTAVVSTAPGQTRDENRARCEDRDPDLSIGGCTALIQSGQEPTASLAIAFNNRGNAYRDKGQYDRAIEDYDQAIRLNPNYAEAYNNRGLAKRAKGDFAGGDADIAKAKQLNPSLGN